MDSVNGSFSRLFGNHLPTIQNHHQGKIDTLLKEVQKTQEEMANLQNLLRTSPILQEYVALEDAEFSELRAKYEAVQQNLQKRGLELDLTPLDLEKGKKYSKQEIEERVEKLQGNLKVFMEILQSKNQVEINKISGLHELSNLIFSLFSKLVQAYVDYIKGIQRR